MRNTKMETKLVSWLYFCLLNNAQIVQGANVHYMSGEWLRITLNTCMASCQKAPALCSFLVRWTFS